MIEKRIIPCLQLNNSSLVKTIKFKKINYIGDPINTIRIFNEIGVDEISFIDIRATINKTPPNYDILQEIANECFVPLSYGGGISNLDQVKKILNIGFEKVILNSITFSNPEIVTEIAKSTGSQSLICSIDLKKNFFGKYFVYSHSGKRKQPFKPIDWSKKMEDLGAGELLITIIDREGTWNGFDNEIFQNISNSVSIPVIAHGGGGSVNHVLDLKENTNVSAIALGSLLVFQSKGMGVLVNFPEKLKYSL